MNTGLDQWRECQNTGAKLVHYIRLYLACVPKANSLGLWHTMLTCVAPCCLVLRSSLTMIRMNSIIIKFMCVNLLMELAQTRVVLEK